MKMFLTVTFITKLTLAKEKNRVRNNKWTGKVYCIK